MYDAWIAIKDLGALPILGAVVIVGIFIAALNGKGKGGDNSNNKPNS